MRQICSRCGQPTDLMGGHLTDAECARYRRTTYEPDPFWLRGNITTCVHCCCVQEAHHRDGHCYTVEEIVNRLRFTQRTGRWPEPDEGCEEEEGGPGG